MLIKIIFTFICIIIHFKRKQLIYPQKISVNLFLIEINSCCLYNYSMNIDFIKKMLQTAYYN